MEIPSIGCCRVCCQDLSLWVLPFVAFIGVLDVVLSLSFSLPSRSIASLNVRDLACLPCVDRSLSIYRRREVVGGV